MLKNLFVAVIFLTTNLVNASETCANAEATALADNAAATVSSFDASILNFTGKKNNSSSITSYVTIPLTIDNVESDIETTKRIIEMKMDAIKMAKKGELKMKMKRKRNLEKNLKSLIKKEIKMDLRLEKLTRKKEEIKNEMVTDLEEDIQIKRQKAVQSALE